MHSELEEIAERLAGLTDGLDLSLVGADDAVALVDVYTRIERIGASGRAVVAPRAAQAGAWKREGFRSAEEWLARRSGTGTGKAKRTLELGERLQRHEQTRDDFTAGRVSQDQAEIVTGAADENPASEPDLLDAAQRESMKTLRREAARAKAEVSDEESRQAKLHDQRYASAGNDEEGAYRGGWRMANLQGGIFDTLWQRFRDRVAADAKKKGVKLTAGQIGADALVLMAQTAAEVDAGDTPTGVRLPEVTLHLLVNEEAWQRGRTEAGEVCEIDGIGTITVSQARQLTAHGAFVTASTWDGTDVHRVAHLGTCDPASLTTEKIHEKLAADGVDVQEIDLPGRAHIPAVLDTAIMMRDRTCRHPGCDCRWRLQRDHKHAVALGGRTTYHQLQRLCWNHHEQKTEQDMRRIRAAKRRRPDNDLS